MLEISTLSSYHDYQFHKNNFRADKKRKSYSRFSNSKNELNLCLYSTTKTEMAENFRISIVYRDALRDLQF